jgi:hypothetical protein
VEQQYARCEIVEARGAVLDILITLCEQWCIGLAEKT